jgi:hypothetical protein
MEKCGCVYKDGKDWGACAPSGPVIFADECGS